MARRIPADPRLAAVSAEIAESVLAVLRSNACAVVVSALGERAA